MSSTNGEMTLFTKSITLTQPKLFQGVFRKIQIAGLVI